MRCELLHESSRVHLTMVQMPALYTPQFDWARNKTGWRPQPAGPVFQPELAAEAILFAATARRRELWVGLSTIEAILGADPVVAKPPHPVARERRRARLN